VWKVLSGCMAIEASVVSAYGKRTARGEKARHKRCSGSRDRLDRDRGRGEEREEAEDRKKIKRVGGGEELRPCTEGVLVSGAGSRGKKDVMDCPSREASVKGQMQSVRANGVDYRLALSITECQLTSTTQVPRKDRRCQSQPGPVAAIRAVPGVSRAHVPGRVRKHSAQVKAGRRRRRASDTSVPRAREWQ